jgi:hypothetical protein
MVGVQGLYEGGSRFKPYLHLLPTWLDFGKNSRAAQKNTGSRRKKCAGVKNNLIQKK